MASRDSKAGGEGLVQDQPIHVVPADQVEDGTIQLLLDEGPVHQAAVHCRGVEAEAADPLFQIPVLQCVSMA